MIKDKNILFIVHKYNSFQKDPIEEASKYFKKVYVLVRYKPISSIIKKLPFENLKVFAEDIVIDLYKVPSNVEVIKTPVWYFPFEVFNKWVGNLHYRAVKKIIEKEDVKFDIIHSHFIWSSGYVGAKLKEKYDVPLVITGHGFDVYKLPFENRYWKEKIKRIIKKADMLVTVSDFNKRKLKNLGVDMKKVEVINNGYSIEDFSPKDKNYLRKELQLPLGEKICVSVGNLEKVKGFDILIKSIKKLKDEGIKIRHYIIGEGTQKNSLIRLVKDLNLDDTVFIIGSKPHNEVGKWINACDVFVIPSRIESASVVLLEALACGKPVVGTRTGIIPKILNKNSGIVTKVSDVNSLAEAIKSSFNKKWDKRKIVESVKEYSWENTVKKNINIYKKLLND
jgi:glycosyltransferase involved in cell wall biosynthesis